MSTSFLSLTLPAKRPPHGRWALLIAALSVLVPATAARADLVMNAISVNFTNSSNLLDASEVAGNATEGSFANWNNVQSGTSANNLNFALYPQDWEAPPVDLSIYTGAMNSSTPYPILSYGGTQFGSNPWSGGVTMNTPAVTPTAVDLSQRKLYASGAVVTSTNGPVGTFQNGIFSLSGLNAAFPYGYKVYVYQSAGAGNNTGSYFGGGIYASGTTSGTRDFGPANYISPGSANNVAMTFGTAGSTTNAWGAQNNAAFDGTFANNKFVTITKTGGGLITSDVFSLSQAVYSQFTGVTNNQLITGIQIVGEVEVIPEPASIAMGLCGVGGFAAYGFLRRARGRRQQAAGREQDPSGTA